MKEKTVMFRVDMFEIIAYDIIRMTDCMVTFEDSLWGVTKENKKAKFVSWFDTWEKAYIHLLYQSEAEIIGIKQQLASAQQRAKEFLAMTDPSLLSV